MPFDTDILARTTGLADAAYGDLATFFTDVDHNPSGTLCARTMASLRNYFDQQNHTLASITGKP